MKENNKKRLSLFAVVAFALVIVCAGVFKSMNVLADESTEDYVKSSVMEDNNGEVIILSEEENTTGAAIGIVVADISDSKAIEVGTQISLSTNTTGTAIIFTMDGTSPDGENGKVYSSPITIQDDVTVKAVARKGGVYGEILVLDYKVLKVGAVKASIESGLVDFGTEIELTTNTTGAAIYYTIEDFDFDENTTSQAIKYEGPLKIESNVKIRTFASKEGYKNSEYSEYSYQVERDVLVQKDFEEKVKAGDFATLKIKAKNNQESEQMVSIVFVAYDEKDVLIDYVMVNDHLEKGETVAVESGFKVANNCHYIRAFVVDNFTSLKPISNVVEIKVER